MKRLLEIVASTNLATLDHTAEEKRREEQSEQRDDLTTLATKPLKKSE